MHGYLKPAKDIRPGDRGEGEAPDLLAFALWHLEMAESLLPGRLRRARAAVRFARGELEGEGQEREGRASDGAEGRPGER